MPPRPLPLVAVPPSSRPKEVDPLLWAFPQRLADAANQRGIGQQALAKSAGIAQSTISRWLHYQVEGLRVCDLLAVERALSLPSGWLIQPAAVPAPIRRHTPAPESTVVSSRRQG